jgi:uncharacterized protein YcbX
MALSSSLVDMIATTVGRVVSIHRYPVKSMQGEALPSAHFDELGGLGDRRFGLVNEDGTHVLSAKREPALLLASATSGATAGEPPRIELPDGSVIDELGDDADARLSDWLGRPVHLRAADDETGSAYRMSFNVDDEDDGVFEVPTQPGHYFDLAAVHLLTTASLREAERLRPEGNWNPHRFRPTILVETEPDLTGFVENDWVGQVLTIGSLQIDVLMPTIRCAMTTRAQPAHELERDLDIFKTLGKVNDSNLGLYASIRTPGTASVGDDVTLDAPS